MGNPFDVLQTELLEIKQMLNEMVKQTGAQESEKRNAVDRVKAAEYLGVSPGTIDNLTKSGRLKPFYAGAAKRYTYAELDRFTQQQ